jgi:threonine aldolase
VDPTVIHAATMFGMVDGNDGKPTAIHATRGQLIADNISFIDYEGAVPLTVVFCCLLDGNRGMITAEQVAGPLTTLSLYHSP